MKDHYKKFFLGVMAALLFIPFGTMAQVMDEAPSVAQHGSHHATTKALFDIQWQINIGEMIAPGAANRLHNGVAWTGTEFWFSRWNNDTMWTTDISGNLLSTFTIAGVGQVRSITWDGTHLYMGAAGSEIYQIDPATKTLVSTINLAGGNVGARMCAYDPTADGGNGGFWIGNFTSDIQLVSMTGAILTTVTQATHGIVGIYGGAVDIYTAGGPYLWVYAQPGSPSDNVLYHLEIPAGVQSGLFHDVDDDIPNPGALAGGAFITDDLVVGEKSLVVCTQDANNGSPLTSYALEPDPIGIEESNTIEVTMQPNPANNEVRISMDINEKAALQLIDAKGATALEQTINNGSATIDVSGIDAGTYIVLISSGNNVMRERLVITH